MAEERAALRAKLRARRPRRRSLRRRLLLLALLVLLLMLLRECECDCAVAVPPPAAEDATPSVAVVDAGPVVVTRATKRPLRGRLQPRDRPKFRNEAPPALSWLTAFRLQVAARSPRLSHCFEGTARPGAFKWTAAIDIARGLVSDHQLEPVLAGAPLSKKLRTCLVYVLSTPPYALPALAGRPSPSRVSIVIEF